MGYGIPVELGEMPSQVYVQYKRCNEWISWMCGGTLVQDRTGNQWVLTAAHCLNSEGKYTDPTIREFLVRAGMVDRFNPTNTETRIVPNDPSHIIFHPDWYSSDCIHNCNQECPRQCNQCRGPRWSGKISNNILKS